MNTEILAVGTELLMGQIANTNAQYISKRLQDIGFNVYYHSVVGDNPERLRGVLLTALDRVDLVIMTGGLGPTQDDLTKETVARVMGRKLVLHEPSWQRIKHLFESRGWTMVDSNKKQAYFPEGCLVMPNDHGSAPGCIIENLDKIVAMLPGPPYEMKPMFEQALMPYLEKRSRYKIKSRYIVVRGIGESQLENMLLDLIDAQDNPTIATYAKKGEVAVRITARYEKNDDRDIITPVEKEITARLGDAVYSVGDEAP